MKRMLTFLIVFTMLFTCIAPLSLAEAAPSQITIGSVTAMSGYFYTELWGSNTSDMDVRGLIHGYSTVSWQQQGEYAIDPTVVENVQTGLDGNGDKVYRFTLKNGLTWNNGQPITARNYVFSVLLQSSPELAGLGVSNGSFAHLRGWEDYGQNSAAPFTGVRLESDTIFSLTIKADVLPYFYELTLVNVEPTPISVVAPGMTVADNGTGAYLTADTAQPGTFTTDGLRQTLLGENGYVTAPALTCGPYTLESYDSAAHTARFTKNPYYLGNYENQLPEFDTITFRQVDNATMLNELANGTVDILNKVSDGEIIAQGLQMVNDSKALSNTYMRSGFAYLSFACEDETASQTSVRQAIAMCVDVDAICSGLMNGYAMPVYGYYGLGQWMASNDTEQLNELNRYGYDPTGAKQLLINDGWIYNADGISFTEGKDTMRYKIVDGRLVPLELRVAMPQQSVAADQLTQQLTDAGQTLGASVTIDRIDFDTLLTQYYRQTERTYNLMLLGTNFSHIFDPYYTFNTGSEYQGVMNTTGLADEELMQLADEMRNVSNDDVDGYFQKWMAFQQRWVELLPMIPLYSNVYFDFTRPDLYSYEITAHWGWASAILYATFTQPAEDVLTTDPGGDQIIIE